MSEENKETNIDNSRFYGIKINGGWLFLLLCLMLAFCGTPDLHDAMIDNLMKDCEEKS